MRRKARENVDFPPLERLPHNYYPLHPFIVLPHIYLPTAMAKLENNGNKGSLPKKTSKATKPPRDKGHGIIPALLRKPHMSLPYLLRSNRRSKERIEVLPSFLDCAFVFPSLTFVLFPYVSRSTPTLQISSANEQRGQRHGP